MNPDFSLNGTAYHEYSPVFLSTTSVLSYGLGFAATISVIVHTFLCHRQAVWNGFLASIGRNNLAEKSEIHYRVISPHFNVNHSTANVTQLMRQYKQVPMWWYAGVFLGISGISIAFFYIYDTELPWYGFILAVVLDMVLIVPAGIIMAICSITLSTAVISALTAGYIWPRQIINNVVFKIFTLVSSYQGLGFIKDMKIGHYMVNRHELRRGDLTARTEDSASCHVCGSVHWHHRIMDDSDSGQYLSNGKCWKASAR